MKINKPVQTGRHVCLIFAVQSPSEIMFLFKGSILLDEIPEIAVVEMVNNRAQVNGICTVSIHSRNNKINALFNMPLSGILLSMIIRDKSIFNWSFLV